MSWYCSPCLFGSIVKKLPGKHSELGSAGCCGCCACGNPCMALVCAAPCVYCCVPQNGLILPLQSKVLPVGVQADNCFTATLCMPCLLVQMANEVDARIAANQPVLTQPQGVVMMTAPPGMMLVPMAQAPPA
jgi:hypothetical protein